MTRWGALIALGLVAAAPDSSPEPRRLSAREIAEEFQRSQAPVEIDEAPPARAASKKTPAPARKAKVPAAPTDDTLSRDTPAPAQPTIKPAAKPASAKPALAKPASAKTTSAKPSPATPTPSAKAEKKPVAEPCSDKATPDKAQAGAKGSRRAKPCSEATPNKKASEPDQKAPAPASADKAADRPSDGSDTGIKAPGGQKPVWEVKTVDPEAIEVTKSAYLVQPGDTLSAVVRKTHAGADVIAHANDLKPPFTLRPGQKLKIPGGRYHIVKKGQSGIAIARAYGVEWTKIIELNHLQQPFTLREGQRLMLPPAKDVAKMTLEQRASAFQIDLTDLATGSEPALAPAAKPAAPTPSPKRQLSPTTPVAEPETAFAGRFDWPVEGRVVRAYGPTENGGRNDGITIAAPRGTAILAAADGVVMWVGEHPAFGKVVLVRHGSGWITIYGNADKLLVKRGQAVRIGQTIALVGATGATADQPQTFFEVLQGRKPINPMSLLPKRDRKESDAAPDDGAGNRGDARNSD